jgi:hypothetical protein
LCIGIAIITGKYGHCSGIAISWRARTWQANTAIARQYGLLVIDGTGIAVITGNNRCRSCIAIERSASTRDTDDGVVAIFHHSHIIYRAWVAIITR